MRSSSTACCVALGLSLTIGCIQPEPDFTLTLSPSLVSPGILGTGAVAKLVLVFPDGSSSVTLVGSVDDPDSLLLDVPAPIPAGTRVGLLVEDAGGPDDAWSPSATRAYGQAWTDTDLVQGDHVLEIDLIPTGEIAELDVVGENRRRWSGAAVTTAGGATYLFGGGDPEDRLTASNIILKLDPTAPSFSNVGQMPVFEGAGETGPVEVSAYTQNTATLVTVDEQEMILVAGGRSTVNGTFESVRGWFLFDPATDTIVDSKETLTIPRSGHQAMAFADGDVLIWGGVTDTGVSQLATFEIWKAGNRRVVDGDDLGAVQAGRIFPMMAPLDNDIIVCGGFTVTLAVDTIDWTPQSGCDRIQTNGDVEPFPALPAPLAAGAMLALADGSLYVTGGTTDTLTENWFAGDYDQGTATDVAYRYDPEAEEWQIASSLGFPRGRHAMVEVPGKGVLVIGGSTEITPFFGRLGEAVRCIERYDPESGEITEEQCTDVGRGSAPLVSSYPGEYVFVMEGTWGGPLPYEGEASTYGLTSLGPPL
ncbi:MAG: hypothetical protein KTR31_24600 [Myxococcales bacterium]|nr:hypothetical protein [Myxococcales bacterium]